MLTRNTRRLVFVVLVLGLFALVRLWPDKPSRDHDTSRPSFNDVATQQVSAAAPSVADTAAPASVAPDRVGASGVVHVETSAMETSRQANVAPVRLQVDVPSDVQVGEVFQARIDLEADSGVRQLMFAVSYDKSRLVLVGWSEGNFAQQGGLPAELGAEEPSDGNIQVSFNVGNGLSVAGAGSMAVFQFEAIKPGTSGITLQNFTAIDATGVTEPNVVVLHAGSVTIH